MSKSKFFVEKTDFIKDFPDNPDVCYLLARMGIMRYADGRWTERVEIIEYDSRIGFAGVRHIQERDIHHIEGFGRARELVLKARREIHQRIKDRPLREAIETVRASREKVELEGRQARSRQAMAEKHPELMDPAAAATALSELKGLLVAHPTAARITRKGILMDGADNPVGTAFANLHGMKAWLFQNGFRASVDDREHFFAAASVLQFR